MLSGCKVFGDHVWDLLFTGWWEAGPRHLLTMESASLDPWALGTQVPKPQGLSRGQAASGQGGSREGGLQGKDGGWDPPHASRRDQGGI